LAEGKAAVGEFRGGIDASPESDEVRGKYAVWILENKHPGLLTLHLIALDHIEHEAQAFSPKAMAVLERLDVVIGKVWDAANALRRVTQLSLSSPITVLPITGSN